MVAALAVAGCGGGGATQPRPPRRPRRRLRRPRRRPWPVRVTDGDTGAGRRRGRGGASRRSRRGAGPDRRRRAGGGAPGDGGRDRDRAAPPARARVRDGAAAVDLYDPRLQSPEYGGGASRDRYVPAVRVPPPAGRPAWTFEPHPPGVPARRQRRPRRHRHELRPRVRRRRRRRLGGLGPAPEGRSPPAPRSRAGGPSSARWAASSWPTAWGRAPPLDLLDRQPDRELAADRRRAGLRRHLGGGLYAVDAATGKQRWRYQAPDDIKGSAALASGLIVVGDYSGNLHALDPRSGAERWTYTGGARFYGGPAVSGDTIVIGDVGGAVIALGARAVASGGATRPAGLRLLDRRDRRRGRLHRLLRRQLPGPRPRRRLGALVVRRGRRDLGLGHRRGRRRLHRAPVRPGQPRRTYGLDTRTGAVRFETDDGRYSPAVGAGGRCTSWARGTCMPTLPRRRKRLWLGLAGLAAALLIAGGVWHSASPAAGSTRAASRGRPRASRRRKPPRGGRGGSWPGTGTTPSGRGPTRRSACGPLPAGGPDAGSLMEFPPCSAEGGRWWARTRASRWRSTWTDGGCGASGCADGSPPRRPSPATSPCSTIRGDVVALRAADGRQVWRRRRLGRRVVAARRGGKRVRRDARGPGPAAGRPHRGRALERRGRGGRQGQPGAVGAERGRRRLRRARDGLRRAPTGGSPGSARAPGRACAEQGALRRPRWPTGGSSSAT